MRIGLGLSWWDDIGTPVETRLDFNFTIWSELGAIHLFPATRAAIGTVLVAWTVFRTFNSFSMTSIMAHRVAVAIIYTFVVFLVAMVIALENFVLPLVATRSWRWEDSGAEVGEVFVQ